jgi:hypothetical protein
LGLARVKACASTPSGIYQIAAEYAKISPEAVLALAVRALNSMKTSTGLSRLEIHCGRPARHRHLSEELFSLSLPVLPASAHAIEEFMNAADEKKQLHQVMRAFQRLNASLCAQVTGRPPALCNGDSFLYWRTSVVRSQSGWRGPAIVIAQQRNVVIGFMGGIAVLCHRTELYCSNTHPATKCKVYCWMTTHSHRFKEKELTLPHRPR